MSVFTPAAPLRALAFVALLGMAPAVQASTLVVDRGLPGDNLNGNPAGVDRSNLTVTFLEDSFQTGDTFTLPSTGNPSLPSWRIDRLRTWFVELPVDQQSVQDPRELQDLYSDISLFLGPDVSATGGSIDKVSTSPIFGNEASGPNVTITPVQYSLVNGGTSNTGSLNFQPQDRELDLQIWQVDFTNLGKFSAGDYMFSMAGFDDPLFFNHASVASLGGVPANGADGEFVAFSGTADSSSLGFNSIFSSLDINVQVYATPVPLPAALPLLLAALGGLGIAARQRRKAA